MLTAEQSNTSLVFGEAAILKVFRRVCPGPEPRPGGGRGARPSSARRTWPSPTAWIETRMDGATTVLAILSHYLRAAADGWSLAATSVRDLYAAERRRG